MDKNFSAWDGLGLALGVMFYADVALDITGISSVREGLLGPISLGELIELIAGSYLIADKLGKAGQ